MSDNVDSQLQPKSLDYSHQDELETLFETSNLVIRQRDLKRAFITVLDGLQKLVPYDSGAVHYHRATDGWISTISAQGQLAALLVNAKIPYEASLLGRCMQRREFLKVDDVRSHLDSFSIPSLVPLASETMLLAPLQVDEQGEGWALAIGRSNQQTFTEREYKLFQIFANYAEVAIENARLYEVALRETEALRRVNVILPSIGSLKTSDQIYHRVAEEIGLVMDYSRLSIAEIDRENDKLNIIFDSLIQSEVAKGKVMRTQFPFSGSATEMAVNSGRYLLRSDTSDRSGLTFSQDYYLLENGSHSYVVFPLRHEEQTNRVMTVHCSQPNGFDQAKLNFLEILAGQLAVIAENINLFDRLRLTRRQWQVTLDSIPDAVLMLKADDLTILQVNRAAAELAASRPDEVVGKNYRDVFYGVDPCLCNFPIDQLQHPGAMFSEEANGTFSGRIYQRSIYPVFDGNGALSELVTHVREVTATKMMEQQLAQNARLKAVGEMAAGIAHDFNNSLAGILGNVELMMTETNDPQLRAGLSQLKQAALDGADTVRRIQSFGRKDGRKSYRKFDLNTTVREVVELTRPRWQNQAQQQGIYIGVVLKLRDNLTVFGNPAEIKEAITNLLFNAIDAMVEGGTLTLSSKKELWQGDSVAVLNISDTGNGIPPDIQEKIFDPFFTTKGLKGTGLGLSMARQIMAEHEGEINFESINGQGTTFHLRFPLVQPDRNLRSRSIEAGISVVDTISVKGSHKRVLVIDDDRTLCSVLKRILERQGHQVDVADGGKQGLEIFRKSLGDFDIIFTDLSMPEMSGYEVARVMKSLDPQVIIVLMTGWGADLNSEDLASRGIDFHIAKPYRMTDVQNLLEKAYELRRQGKLTQFVAAQE